ncbi:MAG: hypothetical protein Q8Q89_05175 [bacterium]|nr:hypothetical protein [bacterium]
MQFRICNLEFGRNTKLFGVVFVFLLSTFYFLLSTFVFGAIEDEIATRQQQIDEIQRQIEEYQKQIETNQSQARTLETEINSLNAQVRQIELTIRSLELSINQASSEISDVELQVTDLESKILKHRDALAQFLKITYENDQKTLTEILLSNDNLSDFFTIINDVRANQENLQLTIEEVRNIKTDLEQRQENLEEKRSEFERLRGLEAIEKRSLDGTKSSKNKILKDTKGQEKKFQELVGKSKKDLEALRAQITYLAQNGVTAEEAVKYGQLAAIATGIRPAYLIAVLEVESGLGRNVGRCNRAEDPSEKHWQKIMHIRDHNPFLIITSKLGLNPDITAVSCPQYVNGRRYGWGGAMGAAQFIPSTWLAYEEEVSRIVGRPANPWSIEDAFMAAAVKLARGGATAKTRVAEVAASKAYYSGKSYCSNAPCNSYANAIQRKATEIEKNL